MDPPRRAHDPRPARVLGAARVQQHGPSLAQRSILLSARGERRASSPRRGLRLFAGLAAAALLAALVLPLGRRRPLPIPDRVHGRAAFAERGEGELRAGASRVRIEHADVRNLYARALALEAGGLRAVIVALDALLIPGPLEEEVLREAGLGERACLLLAATHTHAGAGGTWNNLLAEASGNGVYQAELAHAHARAAAGAAVQALRELQPARLEVAQERWRDAPAEARGPGPLDDVVTALRAVRPDGRVVATAAILALHPTVVRRQRGAISGDWPAEAARFLEETARAPALVLQGAGGDSTWRRADLPSAPAEAAAALGERVARHALSLLGPAARGPARQTTLGCAVRLFALPPAQASLRVPWPLRRAATTGLALFAEPFALRTTIELPGLRLLGVPGEPVGLLGISARSSNRGRTALVSLADGYLGYVETEGRARAGAGESARTYYGPGLARAIGLEP